MREAPLAAALAAGLLAGCAKVNPRPAFGDVEKTVRDRTGLKTGWARSVDETEALEKTVRALLQENLGVDSAVQVALLTNRSLQATFEEIGISQADVVQAGLLTNPELDVSFRFPHGGGKTNSEFGIVKDFLDFLVLPLRKKMALAELERTKLRVGDEVLALVAEVKRGYYTLQASSQLVDRLKLIREVNQAAAEFAAGQHAAGNVSDLDLAQHEAVYKQSRVDVAQAELEARLDREKLNRLLGLWGGDTAWTLDAGLPPLPEDEVPLDRLESLAMERRLDLQAARWEVDLVGRALALKKGTRYFPIGVNVGVDTEVESDGPRVTGPSLSLQLPVFDYGQASVARLESQLFQAARRLEAMAVNARSEVRQARDLLIATRDLTRYYGKVLLPQRVEILDLTQRQFNMMLKGVYDLLAAKQSEVQTERAYIEAWRDYWIAKTELERALGGTLPTYKESTP